MILNLTYRPCLVTHKSLHICPLKVQHWRFDLICCWDRYHKNFVVNGSLWTHFIWRFYRPGVGASSCHDSLIFMSTHKATAARCLRSTAVRVATLRRLALSVLFTTINATTSYQTTCTVSIRTFNKRQHANARYGVESHSHTDALRHRVVKNIFPQISNYIL